MSSIKQEPGKRRYIVRSDDPQQLAGFIEDVKRDSNMELIDKIGPANQPHTVVVEMSDSQADELRQRLQAAKKPLTIEPDRPLSLFDVS